LAKAKVYSLFYLNLLSKNKKSFSSLPHIHFFFHGSVILCFKIFFRLVSEATLKGLYNSSTGLISALNWGLFVANIGLKFSLGSGKDKFP
jgi:hypothetical protein